MSFRPVHLALAVLVACSGTQDLSAQFAAAPVSPGNASSSSAGITSRSKPSVVGSTNASPTSPEVRKGPVFRDPRTGRYMQQLVRTENVEVQRFDWRPRTANTQSGSALAQNSGQVSPGSGSPQYQLAPRLVRTWNPFSPTKIVWDYVPVDRPANPGASASSPMPFRSVERQQYVVLQPVDRVTAEAYEASRRQAVGNRTAFLPVNIPQTSTGAALTNGWTGSTSTVRATPTANLQPSYSAGIRAMEERGMPAQVLR